MKFFRVVIISAIVLGIGVGHTFAKSDEYKPASNFARIVTNMMGYNFIAKKIAQGVLKKSLKKTAKGDYKVKFDSFSGIDLKKGKFRGLTILGENLVVEDSLYISRFYMKTTSDFNYVDYRKNPMIFKTDIPFAYEVELTESDLNNTFSMGNAFDLISALLPLVTVEKPKITIENQKIRIKSALKMPFSKSVKFSMSAGLKVENGQIVMNNVESSGPNDFAEKLINLINRQNVLQEINMSIFKSTETKASVDNVKIQDKKIYIDGTFKIKKSES